MVTPPEIRGTRQWNFQLPNFPQRGVWPTLAQQRFWLHPSRSTDGCRRRAPPTDLAR